MMEIAAAGQSSVLKERMELFVVVAVVRSLVALTISATDVAEMGIAVLTETGAVADVKVVGVA